MRTGLPVGLRRYKAAPLTAKTRRRADRMITLVQEWLEDSDTPRALAAAWGILGLALLFLAGQIIRAALR